MRRWLRNIKFILTMLALMLSVYSFTVFAQEPITVALPVSVRLTGALPETLENLTVVLAAEQPENPMPNGTVGGVYAMDIIGSKQQNFPELVYDKAGIYKYRIYQEKGADKQGVYDENVYFVMVTVLQNKNGGFDVSVGVHKNDVLTEPKAGAIEFANHYRTTGGGGGGDDDGGGGNSGGSGGGTSVSTQSQNTDSNTSVALVPPFPFAVPLSLPQTGTFWWLAGILTLVGASVFLGGAITYKVSKQ